MVVMDVGTKKTAPEVETRWAFISTNRRIQLAAAVASYVSVTDKYVAFFEFPSLKYSYTGSANFGADGYITVSVRATHLLFGLVWCWT